MPLRKLSTASVLSLSLLLAGTTSSVSAEAVHPVKLSAGDIGGAIFDSPAVEATTHADGHKTLDVTSLKSSDGKFATGMYRSGKTRAEISEPYGVDEFMYFLEGGVTLTSSDGTVTEVGAGEGLSLPKEWTGIWDTNGYTKIWVIYSADGSGL